MEELTFRSELHEARFERILEVVEEAGFDSMDAMMAAYYNTNFSEYSPTRPLQSVGRTRRLRSFLASLHSSHVEWGERERSAYREEVARAAEGIYAQELRELMNVADSASAEERPPFNDSEMASVEAKRAYIVEQIRDIVSNQGIVAFLKKDKEILQDSVSFSYTGKGMDEQLSADLNARSPKRGH